MFKNMLKRSWLSITRKPSRSLILVLILFVMANLLLAMVSIKNTVDESTSYAKEQIGGVVYLQPDTEAIREQAREALSNGEVAEVLSPTISEELASTIAESEYLKDYTYSIVSNANATSYEVVETAQNERERQFQAAFDNAQSQVQDQVNQFNSETSEFNSEIDDFNAEVDQLNESDAATPVGPGGGGGQRINRPNFGGKFDFNLSFNLSDPSLERGDVEVQGINSPAFISDIESGSMKIIEGEAFDEASENGVLISTEVAEANSITVGDEIVLATTSDATEISLKVLGIYQTTTEDFNYNIVYTNVDTAKNFVSEEQVNDLNVQNVRYYLASAEDKDAFLAETNAKYPSLANENLIFDIDDNSYQTMVGPIEHVGSFSVTVLWIVIIAAVSIITLIVVINVKDRRYEMGVLLSIGAKRANILGQVFIELVVVSTVGFMLSLGTSQMVAQAMGDNLLEQQITSEQKQAEETSSNEFGRGQFAVQQQTLEVEQIDEIDVTAGPEEYATLFGMGYLILITAMIVPSINILRYEPKSILTSKE